MSVDFAGIEVIDSVLLKGLETSSDVSINQIDVEDGSSVLQIMPYSGTRDLFLVFPDDGEGLERWKLMAIKAVARNGQPVNLEHHLGNFTVLIESTASMKPMFEYANPDDNDLYVGSIKIKEVNQNA